MATISKNQKKKMLDKMHLTSSNIKSKKKLAKLDLLHILDKILVMTLSCLFKVQNC